MASYGPEALARDLGISRETIDRLEVYATLIRRWQPAINLIGPDTLGDVWRRHFYDSGQLLRHLPARYDAIYDIGSGAGFPGLVLAILGAHDVHLVESDQRKCAFLREAVRQTGATAAVLPSRVESLVPPSAGWPKHRVIVARALAPIDKFLDLARPLLGADSLCIMLKGQKAEAEVAEARRHWSFRHDSVPSSSDPRGVILIMSGLINV